MYRTVKIGDKDINLLANGATPIRYRMVFGRDILSELQKADQDGGLMASSISELTYIMAMSADDSVDMSKINVNTYVKWLEQFEAFDITMAADQIIDVYMGNTTTTSEIKKKASGKVSGS